MFLLFSGAEYEGYGWCDFKGKFTTLADAVNYVESPNFDSYREWWHVVDMDTLEIVQDGSIYK